MMISGCTSVFEVDRNSESTIDDESTSPINGPFIDSSALDFSKGTYGNNTEYSSTGLQLRAWSTSEREVLETDTNFDMSGIAGIFHINEPSLNETVASTVTNSFSGGANGTLSTGDGAANKSVTGQLSEAIQLDGVDDQITVNDYSNISDIFDGDGTVAIWVKTQSDGENDTGYIFDKNTSPGSFGWSLNVKNENTNGVQLEFLQSFTSGNKRWTTVDRTLPIGEWMHVAITYDSSALANDAIIYINGKVVDLTVNSTASGVFASDAGIDLIIGDNAASTGGFDGALDEISLWSRSLNQNEITTLYQRQKSAFGGGQVGEYTSQIINTNQDSYEWRDFSWVQAFPFERPLPDSDGQISPLIETGFESGNIDMSDAVLYLRMDATGPTIGNGSTINDLSSFDHDATVYADGGGMNVVTGKFGDALEFDGSNDYLLVDNSSVLDQLPDNDFSISVWFKTDVNCGGTNGDVWVSWRRGSGSTYFTFECEAFSGSDDGRVHFGINDGSGALYTPRGKTVISDNRWHHAVAVVTSTVASVYLDGELESSMDVSGIGTLDFQLSDPIRIGRWQSGGFELDGALDEISIWRKALSLTEIQSMYKRGSSSAKFQVRSCALADCSDASFVGPDGTNGTTFDATGFGFGQQPQFDLTAPPVSLSPNRYFQYKVQLNSENSAFTSKLLQVEVD